MEQETKKKKSGLRKAMLPALAMLLASVLSLTTMTYAWFTSGKDASVENFDLTIAAGGGLEISATGLDNSWKSTLDVSDITALNSYASGESKLSPVSTDGSYTAPASVGSYDDLKLNFFSAEVESGEPNAQLKTATAASKGWVEFPLYFRNAGEEPLSINLGETTVGKPTGHDTENNNGHLAVRMAFVIYGTRDAHVVAGEYTKDAGGSKASIYEPNAEQHTADGTADYEAGLEKSSTSTQKYEYWALKSTYSEGSGISRYSDNAIYTKMMDETENCTYDESHTYFTLAAGKITQIKVFIWIEGQDADCTNFISSNMFNTDLQFTATTE